MYVCVCTMDERQQGLGIRMVTSLIHSAVGGAFQKKKVSIKDCAVQCNTVQRRGWMSTPWHRRGTKQPPKTYHYTLHDFMPMKSTPPEIVHLCISSHSAQPVWHLQKTQSSRRSNPESGSLFPTIPSSDAKREAGP